MKKLIPTLCLSILISCIISLAPSVGQDSAAPKNKTELVGAIGSEAPELAYENPDGEVVSLTSLRGQVVLIDFWAAWCGPCRRANPGLVNVYHQFKDKSFTKGEGFTIYSLSLDNNKETWMSAIKTDKLVWEHHVSDLMGWRSEGAGIYNVNSIPSNYLIDGNGIILAKNLSEEELDDFLTDILDEQP